MLRLLMIVGSTLLLAYMSQKEILVYKITDKFKIDVPLVVMIVVLTLFCGLRTNYNDTTTYHFRYIDAPTVDSFMSETHEWTDNPLYYYCQSWFKENICKQPYLFFTCIAAFTVSSMVCFIKKYVSNFVFGMVLFFATDLMIFNLSAVKQCLAMGVLCIALDQFIKKRYLLFYLLVTVAVLFHTYAIVFAILPILCHKPWTITSYVIVCGTAVLMLVFESFITSFLSAADEIGKGIYEGEVIGAATMNPLRVLVFSVPTIISFVFQQQVDEIYDKKHQLLMNISIMFCLINCLGLLSAANMFGRAATYFAMGTIISLPKMISAIFEEKTCRMISFFAGIAYLGFFLYDNMSFGDQYRALTIGQFLDTI